MKNSENANRPAFPLSSPEAGINSNTIGLTKREEIATRLACAMIMGGFNKEYEMDYVSWVSVKATDLILEKLDQ